MNLDLLQCQINGVKYHHQVNNPAFKFIVAELEVTNFDIKEHGMFSFGVSTPELEIGRYKYKQCNTSGLPQLGLGDKFPTQMKTTFQLVFQVPAVLISDDFKIRMPNGQFSPVWQFKVEGTLPAGERNEVLEQKAIAMAKEAGEQRTSAYWMILLCPGLAMFAVGKVFQGLLCLVLQLTGLGWIPASIWAFITITADANSKQKQAALLRRVANPDNLSTPAAPQETTLEKIFVNKNSFLGNGVPIKDQFTFIKWTLIGLAVSIGIILFCAMCGAFNTHPVAEQTVIEHNDEATPKGEQAQPVIARYIPTPVTASPTYTPPAPVMVATPAPTPVVVTTPDPTPEYVAPIPAPVAATGVPSRNPWDFIVGVEKDLDNHNWRDLEPYLVGGHVNYFGHRKSAISYIARDMDNDKVQYPSSQVTYYPNTFTHEISNEFSPNWNGPMLYDSINVYSVVSERNGRVHRAMTRLTVGYTLNNGVLGIYALVMKVLPANS